jgi:hypothetical protein
MFLSLILIAFAAVGGLALTYLFAEKETFLWRLAAGNIIGSSVFGLTVFIIANFFGLSAATAAIGLLLAAAPATLLLTRDDVRTRFRREWQAAQKQTENADLKKTLRVAYYFGFFLLFVFFFNRAVIETSEGIFIGASQNLGDLPFHLGAIFSFTDGNNFPPENPSFANTKFSYPFIADFLTACLMKFGAGLKDAMFVQNLTWALSLLVILERFVFKLTDSRRAAKLAPVLLFFSGGLGFVWLLNDFWASGKGFFDFLWNLPGDYTIGEKFRWGNSLVALFVTQRSFLVGMPLTIVVLQKLWEIFIRRAQKNDGEIKAGDNVRKNADFANENPVPDGGIPFDAFCAGLLAGMLPLIHLHSLAVLFVVTAFLFVFKPEKWRSWIAFGVGTAVIAIPELLWSTTGSATRTSEFLGWNFGWNKKNEESFFWFWLKNTGVLIPLLLAGIYLLVSKFSTQRRHGEHAETKQEKAVKGERENNEIAGEKSSPTADGKSLLLFYLPFVFLFFICNIAKFAPWEWDNIKILIYWFLVSIPFVAVALVRLEKQNAAGRLIAAVCLVLLTISGAADVWRTVSKQINYGLFDRDAVRVAELIKQKTAPNALFLNAPTYNSAVVLSGRRSLMRYLGHLSSHGIDYRERENDLRRIYEGAATADIFLRKNEIEYVLISPAERVYMRENGRELGEDFFAKYPLVAESGEYRVYKVR